MVLDDGADRIQTESSGSAGTRSTGSSCSGEGSTSERPMSRPLPLPSPSPAPVRIKTFGSMTTQSCSAIQSTWIQRLRPLAKQQEDAHGPHVALLRAQQQGSSNATAQGELRSSDVRPEERLSRFPYSCGGTPSSRSHSASFPPRSHGASAGRVVCGSSPLDSRTSPLQRFFQGSCFADNKAGKAVLASAGGGSSRPGPGESQQHLQDSDNCTNKEHSGRCQNPAQMQGIFPFSSQSMLAPIREPLTVATSNANSETPHIFRSPSEMDIVKWKGKAAVREKTENRTSVFGRECGASEIDRPGREPEAGRLLKFSPFEQSVESNSADTASTKSLPKALLDDLYSDLCSRSMAKVCEACKSDKLGMKKFSSWLKDDSVPIGMAMDIDPVTGRRSKSDGNVRLSLADDIGNSPGCLGEGMRCDVQGASPSSVVKNVPPSVDLPSSYDICGSSSSSLLMASHCNVNGGSQPLTLKHSSDLSGKAAHGKCRSGDRGLHLPLLNSNLFLAAKENYKDGYPSCSNKLGNVKCSSDLEAGIPIATQAANLWTSSVKEKPLQNRSTIDASLLEGSFQGSLKTAATEFTRIITGLGKESDERQKGGTWADQPCLSSLMWLHHWHCSSLGAAQQLKLCPGPKQNLKSTCTIKASMDSKSPDAFGSSRIPEDAVADGPSERDQEKGNGSHTTSPEKLGKGTACNPWSSLEYGSSAQVESSQPGARGIFEQSSRTPSAAAMPMIGSTRQQVCTFIFGGKRAAAERTEGESTQEIERRRPG